MAFFFFSKCLMQIIAYIKLISRTNKVTSVEHLFKILLWREVDNVTFSFFNISDNILKWK